MRAWFFQEGRLELPFLDILTMGMMMLLMMMVVMSTQINRCRMLRHVPGIWAIGPLQRASQSDLLFRCSVDVLHVPLVWPLW